MQLKVAFFWAKNISYLPIFFAKIDTYFRKTFKKEDDEQENIKNASVDDSCRNHDWSGDLF